MGSQGIHLNEPARSRPVGRAATPAWRGRKRSLGPMLAVAWTVATMWATLACGMNADERMVHRYAECMADPNTALHRLTVSKAVGTVALSAEAVEERLHAGLSRGEIAMAEIRAGYDRYCE